ncbi:hypothetical protein BDZ88DRAFT_487578 [Geranomyces variabilis]|nr:hypothetical protein BDZ88DRAFT_487578 [Geranomyces variabilis]
MLWPTFKKALQHSLNYPKSKNKASSPLAAFGGRTRRSERARAQSRLIVVLLLTSAEEAKRVGPGIMLPQRSLLSGMPISRSPHTASAAHVPQRSDGESGRRGKLWSAHLERSTSQGRPTYTDGRPTFNSTTDNSYDNSYPSLITRRPRRGTKSNPQILAKDDALASPRIELGTFRSSV